MPSVTRPHSTSTLKIEWHRRAPSSSIPGPLVGRKEGTDNGQPELSTLPSNELVKDSKKPVNDTCSDDKMENSFQQRRSSAFLGRVL